MSDASLKTTIGNVTIIANCHCLPLADAFALGARAEKSDFIDVVFAANPDMAAKIAALPAPGGPDHVFSFPLSEQFGSLATANLRPALDGRLATFTNIHFYGLHPDITYLGAMKKRVTGYFGDYHSKIVLFAYATGRSATDAVALFKGKVFGQLGFYEAFAASAGELRQREAACDIKFAEVFLQMVRNEPCLYTVNHPSGSVFLELAAMLAAHRGLKFARHNAAFFQNHLSNTYVWPVYREIAEEHGLPYRSVQHFVRPAVGRGRRGFDLAEFVGGSYAHYDRTDKAEFVEMVRKMPFFERFAGAM